MPVMMPTANCTAITADQRRASSSATGSDFRRPRWCMTRVMNGNATPSGTRVMCMARVNAISSRAGSSCAGASARRCTGIIKRSSVTREGGGQPPVAKPGKRVIPPST
ncbi:hypothetical protein GCM10020254_74260 [Streptomyces goshikiensis]